jgi:hypothetical protein
MAQRDEVGWQIRLRHDDFSGSCETSKAGLAPVIDRRQLEHHQQPDDAELAARNADNGWGRGYAIMDKLLTELLAYADKGEA